MNHSKILISCLAPLLIVACDIQEPPTTTDDTIELKKAPEKTAIKDSAPILNLSIENIPLEHQSSNQKKSINDEQATEKNSAIFNTLSKRKAESDINLSGKVLTDSDKLENKEYLNSVDGVQLNIEGSFE